MVFDGARTDEELSGDLPIRVSVRREARDLGLLRRELVDRLHGPLARAPVAKSSRSARRANDWLSRPFADNVLRNKPVAVAGASAGMFGAIWGQAELRKVLGTIGARVTEGEVAVGEAAERFDENGGLNEPNLEEELHEVVVTLLADVRSARSGTPSAEPAP